MKIITHTHNGITTEYYNETLKDVLIKLEGKEGILSLEYWYEGKFIKEALIGNLKDDLTGEDYYNAYCIVNN